MNIKFISLFRCVPFYGCTGGLILTNGATLIGIRGGLTTLDPTNSKCHGDLEICCRQGHKIFEGRRNFKHYLTNSYFVFTLKIESVSKITSFGLKMMGEKWSRKNYFEIPPCGKMHEKKIVWKKKLFLSDFSYEKL